MKTSTEGGSGRDRPEDIRHVAELSRRYAQSRFGGPFLLTLAISLALFAAIAITSYFCGKAYLAGNMVGFWICVAFLAIALCALIWFSIPVWGGRWMARVAQRLYRREGNVSLAVPKKLTNRAPLYIAAILFALCIQSSVILGLLGYLPIEYMQPISALYMVPFMVFLAFRMKPIGGMWMLSWPALYAAHAILIVTGAPIAFSEGWQFLNMFIPTAGYGLLCGIITYAANRTTLRKLRRLARVEPEDGITDMEGNRE